MRSWRCYYCERVGTRGFELVNGLDACANLDACNARTHRLLEHQKKGAASLRDEVARVLDEHCETRADAELATDAALAVVRGRIEAALDPKRPWSDALGEVLALFEAERPQGRDAHAAGVPKDDA